MQTPKISWVAVCSQKNVLSDSCLCQTIYRYGTQPKYEFSSANLLFLSSKVNINIILRPKEVKLYTSSKWSLLMYSSDFSVTISHFRLFGLDYTILIWIITTNGCMTILLLVTPTGMRTSLIIKRYEANILSFLSYSCLVWGKTCYHIFRPLHIFMCVHTCLWFSSYPTLSLWFMNKFKFGKFPIIFDTLLDKIPWKHNVFKTDLPVTKLWKIYVRYIGLKL